MKKGEVINGYRILRDFTTAGGGLSKWTFAEKGDKDYFIKEFLSPTYPVEGSPGSSKIKEEKRKRCLSFANHHEALMKALAGKCSEGGNLVVTRAFFRAGPKYYKVTDKIDVASLQIRDIVRLPIERRMLILITVAHSLQILHQAGIVHGDLKPENILIKQTLTRHYTTKLIDFDDSYFSGKPPSREDIVGDSVYYSPELGRYIQEDARTRPQDLTVASDIFALGLIYTQYLTGTLPTFDRGEYPYPYVAVNNGFRMTIDDRGLPPRLTELINCMLCATAADRPGIQEIFLQLKQRSILDEKAETVTVRDGRIGKLRGTLVDTFAEESPRSESKLKGSLLKSTKE